MFRHNHHDPFRHHRHEYPAVTVVTPPAPLFTAQDIIGAPDPDVDDMIAATIAEFDGPAGWLGRSIGPQTLRMSLDCWPLRCLKLPYEPIIKIVSVEYTDASGVDRTLDADSCGLSGNFLWFKPTWIAPELMNMPLPVRIEYEAGYNGIAVSEDGTGPIPTQIKRAVTLSVQYLRALGKDDLFLQVDEVDGVGRKQYVVSEKAGQIIRDAADRLLGGLRIYG
jgi:hypothetical protein